MLVKILFPGHNIHLLKRAGVTIQWLNRNFFIFQQSLLTFRCYSIMLVLDRKWTLESFVVFPIVWFFQIACYVFIYRCYFLINRSFKPCTNFQTPCLSLGNCLQEIKSLVFRWVNVKWKQFYLEKMISSPFERWNYSKSGSELKIYLHG